VGSILECLPRGSRVAIIRLRSLGDCVLTTPALDILRRARPDLRIGVAVEDRFRAIFENNRDVDEILTDEAYTVRRWRPLLCVNLHGGNRSAWMTALSGARFRAGFGHFRFPFIYNALIPRAQQILGVDRTVHTAEHLASAMFWLGAARMEIPRAKLVNRANGDLATAGACATIHPVAANAEKTWRVDGFLAVAEHLKNGGLEPVFVGAANDDLTPFRAFRVVRAAPLSEIKALLGRSSLFVGNDSGPAHMAAAFGLPVVVIFGDSDPAIWGPWRTTAEIVRAPGGMAHVEIAQVLDALTRLRVHA